ncbi:hypothetical protein [Streptococcus ferus]|uniref:hypothetical protein n=1 Tax=Streptococcus ferus TaxID=1345 RepID=UPI0035A1B69C
MLHKEKPDYNRNQYGFYTLDELVPADHFLRQVDKVIDFDFIYGLKPCCGKVFLHRFTALLSVIAWCL